MQFGTEGTSEQERNVKPVRGCPPRVLPVISVFMSRGVREGESVVLDVAQLEALLSRTFGIGLDVGRGKEPVALVRLRLARALLGAAEANAVAAEAVAAGRGIPASLKDNGGLRRFSLRGLHNATSEFLFAGLARNLRLLAAVS